MEEQVTLSMQPPLPDGKKIFQLPNFVKGFVIADLVFCFWHIISIPLMIAQQLINENPSNITAVLVISLIVGISGSSGDIMILKNKPLGIKFAYVNIGGTICSIVVTICYAVTTYMNPPVIDANIDFPTVPVMMTIFGGNFKSLN